MAIIKKKAHVRKGKPVKAHLAKKPGKKHGVKKHGETETKTPGGKAAESALVGKVAGVGGKRHPGKDILGGAGQAN